MTRRARTISFGLAVAALVLTGCSATGAPVTEPTRSATADPTQTPTPTPTEQARLIVTVEGFEFEHDGQADAYSFAEPASMLGVLEELIGDAASTEEVDDPYGGDWGMRYEWDGVSLMVPDEGPASIQVSVAAIADVDIVTLEGLAVGAEREAAVAAGAWDEYDEDSDGVADYLGLGGTEVPGTQSLSRPGEVGIVYVVLVMDADLVKEIHSPGNDFSDI